MIFSQFDYVYDACKKDKNNIIYCKIVDTYLTTEIINSRNYGALLPIVSFSRGSFPCARCMINDPVNPRKEIRHTNGSTETKTQ